MPGLSQLSKEAAERKLKEGISGHRTGLPKKLLELFEPRDALEYKPPLTKRPAKARPEDRVCTSTVTALESAYVHLSASMIAAQLCSFKGSFAYVGTHALASVLSMPPGLHPAHTLLLTLLRKLVHAPPFGKGKSTSITHSCAARGRCHTAA